MNEQTGAGKFPGRQESVISQHLENVPLRESQISKDGPKIKEANPPADWPQRNDKVKITPKGIERLQKGLKKEGSLQRALVVVDFLDLGEQAIQKSGEPSERYRYDLRSEGSSASTIRVYPDEITKSNE